MYVYMYFQDLFDLSIKQTSTIDILLGEISSSNEEKITHMSGYVSRGATCNYILQSTNTN